MSTRRKLLGHLAGITATAVLAWDCLYRGQPHPDGELLAAVERFAAADEQQTDGYFARMDETDLLNLPALESIRQKKAAVEAANASGPDLDAMLREIACIPAYTADGRAAKARVVQRWIGEGWEALKVPTNDPWERVAWSLAQDTLWVGAVA